MHDLQCHAALRFAAAGEVVHAAQAEHLRAVFSRGDMANFFALKQNSGALIAQITVGVNLHFQTAIAEDAFGHHGHHVHAARLGSDDERCGFVIRVSGGCAYAGDEDAAFFRVKRRECLRQGVSFGARHQRLRA